MKNITIKKRILSSVLFACFFTIGSGDSYAQVGIGTKMPDISSALDIRAKDKGLLIPRVSLSATNSFSEISGTPAQSLLVYNINAAITGTGAFGAGYYYWDTNIWKRIITSEETGHINAGTNITITGTGKTTDPYFINTPIHTATQTPSTAIAASSTTVAVPATNVQTAILNLATELKPKWDIRGNAGTSANTNFLGTTDDVDLVFKRKNLFSGLLGKNNTVFGVEAFNNTSTGLSNTAIGNQSLKQNLSGSENTAVGYGSLNANYTGAGNVANGFNALSGNITGNYNVASGHSALSGNAVGEYNVAVGYKSLNANRRGNNNVAVGPNALLFNAAGNYNTAVGDTALGLNANGNNNSAYGVNALGNLNNDDSNSNTAIGDSAGYSYGTFSPDQNKLTLAANGVFLGAQAIPLENNSTNEIVIGYGAVGGGSNTVTIGNSDITSIGGYQQWSSVSDVRLKKDIENSTLGLDFITQLRPVTYHMKTGTTILQTGFIAQEVEAVANSLNYQFNGVIKPASEKDFYTLSYATFVVPLVKAVQEQQTQIKTLEDRLKLLEDTYQRLSDNK